MAGVDKPAGLGPQDGGNHRPAVNIETYPTHIASLPGGKPELSRNPRRSCKL